MTVRNSLFLSQLCWFSYAPNLGCCPCYHNILLCTPQREPLIHSSFSVITCASIYIAHNGHGISVCRQYHISMPTPRMDPCQSCLLSLICALFSRSVASSHARFHDDNHFERRTHSSTEEFLDSSAWSSAASCFISADGPRVVAMETSSPWRFSPSRQGSSLWRPRTSQTGHRCRWMPAAWTAWCHCTSAGTLHRQHLVRSTNLSQGVCVQFKKYKQKYQKQRLAHCLYHIAFWLNIA